MGLIRTEKKLKGKWLPGIWDDEPDLAEWRDVETGYPCLALRTIHSGHWCGYVAIPKDHPWINREMPGEYLERLDVGVHGGITFGPAMCQPKNIEEDWHRICHTPLDGEDENILWIGFDCAHSGDGDISPSDILEYSEFFKLERVSNTQFSIDFGIWRAEKCNRYYRSLDFVQKECAKLAFLAHGAQ